MATAFSSPDQIVQVDPRVDNAQPNLDLEQLEEVFEIERCQTWVNENGYSRVCLQFPDHLLHEAAPVARALQQRLGQLRMFSFSETQHLELAVWMRLLQPT